MNVNMISVIIPSYNSEKTIRQTLNSLINQSYNDSYEIILVDSSIDNTPQVVRSEFPDIKFIHLETKTDPGTARNLGLKESKGDIIAFIDSDCTAADDWLDRIENAHDSPYNVVGGVVNNGNDENDLVAWAGYISEFREFLPEQSKKEVDHIPTCNISYKRKIFDEFGLFQGEYYPQEDLVFNYNLRQKNEKIILDPSIQVYHHHRSVLKDYLAHQKRIGTITSTVLKKIPLEGAFIARHKVAAIFLLPLLPFVKFIRTLIVFLRYQPKTIIKRPRVLAIFSRGLFYWIIGFANGIYRE